MTRANFHSQNPDAAACRMPRKAGAGVGLLVLAMSAAVLRGGPAEGTVVAGSATVAAGGDTTTITAGHNSVLRWGSFNVGPHESVQFIQPGADSRVLNWIGGSAPSQIDGALHANGQVYLVNPSGVYFGRTAVVDVAALYAIGGALSREDFLAGLDRFSSLTGEVRNDGTLRGNSIALVGRTVANTGSILVPDGLVALAAGEQVVLGRAGSSIYVDAGGIASAAATAVNAPTGVSNAGTIHAGRGTVVLAAGDLYSVAIAHDGQLTARDVKLQGQARGDVLVNGTIHATATDVGEKGGRVEVTGEHVGLLARANIDASGPAGGGTILIGGDYQGSNPEVRNATAVWIGEAASLRTDATAAGDGGRIIVWADDTNRTFGSLSGRGVGTTGAGGFVEVSSGKLLTFDGRVYLSAEVGPAGTLLLDPTNIFVAVDQAAATAAGMAGTDLSVGSGPPGFAPSGAVQDSLLLVSTLTTAINGGANVTISTANGDGTGVGDVTFVSAVSGWNSGRSLTVTATRNITVNAGISNDGAGALNLNAGPTGTVAVNGVIALAGGAFSAAGLSFASSSSITTAGGEVTVTAADVAIGAPITAGSGNIVLQPVVDDAPISLAGGVGAFELAQAELNQLGTTGTVVIGRATGSHSVNAGALTLVADTIIRAGTVSFAGTVGGGATARLLTLAGSANGVFNAVGGAGNLISSLSVGGTTTLDGGTVATTGSQTYTGAVTLGGDTTLTGTTGTFTAGVEGGGNDLTLSFTGLTTIEGAKFTGVRNLVSDNGGTTDLSGAITTTGMQTYTDAVTLGAATTLAAGANLVRFGSTLNNAETLAVTGAGGVRFDGSVGGTTPLASVSIGGPSALNGASVQTTGSQTYTGAVTLGGDTTLTGTTGAFTAGVGGGGNDLTLSFTGLTTIDGAKFTGIRNLVSDNGGTTELSGAITTTGTQTYTDAMTLGAATTLAAGANLVRFGSTLNNAETLAVTGAGGVRFDGSVGGTTPLASVSIGGPSALNGASVHTTGTQTYTGAVTLGDNATLTGSTVTFSSTVGGGAAAYSLALDGATNGVLKGTVGGDANRVSTLSVGGATTFIGSGSVTTNGTQTYTGAVTLGGNTTLTGSTGTFTAGIDGDGNDLTMSFTGLTTIDGAKFTDIKNLVSDNGGTTNLSGAVTTTGTQTYVDPVTLGAATTLAAGANLVRFGSMLNNAETLAITGVGGVRFDGNVGGTTPLASVSIQGPSRLNGGLVHTSGNQTYTGAVTLGGNTTLTGTTGTMTAGVDGDGNDLTLSFTGLTTIDGAKFTDIKNLAADNGGTTNLSGAITTAGTQTYADAVALEANVTLASSGVGTGGDITAGSTVNGAHTLVVNTTGGVTFTGSVGGDSPLTALTITAANAVSLAAAVDTRNGAGIALSAGTHLSARAVSTTGTGTGDISFLFGQANSGGTLTLNGSITAVGLVTVSGGTGNDIFNVHANVPTLEGGDGNDEFNFNAGTVGRANGGAGNDIFTLAGGMVTIVDGGAGDDALRGRDGGADSFAVTGLNSGSMTDGPTFSGIEILSGRAGNDTFILAGGTVATVDGGAGDDELQGRDDAADTFLIDGMNSGSLAGGPTFTGIEILSSRGGDDTFTIVPGGLMGTLNGGLGTDTFNGTGNTTLTGNNAGAAATAAFTGIEAINSGGTFTLTGSSGPDSFAITAANAGTVAGLSFSGYATLNGADGDDTFDLSGGSVTGIDGGAGTDTLNGAGNTTLSGGNAGTTGALNFTGIDILRGGGADTLTGSNGSDSFVVASTNSGTVAGLSFSGYGTLNGAAGDDSFVVNSNFGTLSGGSGSDTFTFNAGTTVTVNGDEDGDSFLLAGGSVVTLNGGAGADSFTFSAGTATTANGDSGNDTFTLAGGIVTTVAGGDGADMLQGRDDAADAFAITGASAGSVTGGPAFAGIEAVSGRGGTDTVTLTANDDAVTVTGSNAATTHGIDFTAIEAIDAAGQTTGDEVTLTANDDTVTVDGANAATTSGIAFTNVESIAGGSGVDTLVPVADVTITGEKSAQTAAIDFSAFDRIAPEASGIRLRGTSGDDEWVISGHKSGEVRGFQFENIADLATGGAATDTFTFSTATADIPGTLSGDGAELRITNDGVTTTLSGALSAPGVRFSTTAGGSINAASTANAVTIVAADAAGSVEFVNNRALTVGMVDGVNGATAANLTLTTSAGAVTVLSATVSDSLTINSAAGANLGTVSAGSLHVTAGGAVTNNGDVAIGGAATINAGSNAITLGDASRANFGSIALTGGAVAVTETSAMNVTAAEAAMLTLKTGGALTFDGAPIRVARDASFTSAGAIMDAAGVTLEVGGTASFKVDGHKILLGDSAGDKINFGRVTLEVSDGSVNLTEHSTMAIRGSVTGSNSSVALRAPGIDFAGFIASDLAALSSGPITDSAASVIASASFDAGEANSITLDEPLNDFDVVTLAGGEIVLHDMNSLRLQDVAARGNVLIQVGAGDVALAAAVQSATGSIAIRAGGSVAQYSGGNIAAAASNGAVLVEANEGSITMAAGTRTTAVNGTIIYRAAEEAHLASVTTTGGAVTVTAGDRVRFNDPLVLGGQLEVNAGSGGVTFDRAIDGNGASAELVVHTAGPTVFSEAVGQTIALASLTTDAGGVTAINGSAISTTGAQAYGDAVTLGTSATLSSTSDGAITLASSVDGPHALVVNTAGVATFGGIVGGTTPLLSLTTDAAGTTALGGGAITTTGAQTYGDSVTLGAAATLTSSGNGLVNFGSTVDGAQALSVNTGGATIFGAALGATTALASLTTDAAGTTEINGGTIATAGDQIYHDPVILGADTTLSSSAGDLTLQQAVSAAARKLVATATAGTITVAADLGSENARLQSVSAHGRNLVIGGDIRAQEDIRLAIGAGGGTAGDPGTANDYLQFSSPGESASRDTWIESAAGDVILGSGSIADSPAKTQAPLRSSVFKNNPGDLFLFGRNVEVQPFERTAVSHGSLVIIADGTGAGEGTIALGSTAVANYLVLVSSAALSSTAQGIRLYSRGPDDIDLGKRNPPGQDHGTDLGTDLIGGAVLLFNTHLSVAGESPGRSSAFKPAATPGPTTDPDLFDYSSHPGNIPVSVGLTAVTVVPASAGTMHNVFVADLRTAKSYRPHVPGLVYLDLSTATGFGEYRDRFIDFDSDTFGLTDVNPIRTLVATGAQVRNAVEQAFTPTVPREDQEASPPEAALSAAVREQLQALGIYARPLTETERRSRERRSGLFVTVPAREHPREADYEVVDARVEDRAVREVIRSATATGLIGVGQERLGDVARALAVSFEIFAGAAPNGGGEQFRSWLEGRSEAEAVRVLEFVHSLQTTLQRIELLGLTRQELEGSKAQIYGSVLASRLNAEPEFLRGLVEGLPPTAVPVSVIPPSGPGSALSALSFLLPASTVP